MALFWIIIFIASLLFLVKGADWILDSSEKIGLSFGLSPFVIGVVIVGLGTSFPEIASAIAGVLQGVTEMPAATAIGSNIANILLIVGIATLVGGRLTVSKNLVDLDIPLLAVSTALFTGIVWDRVIVMGEAVLLLVVFVIYILYTIFHKDDGNDTLVGVGVEGEIKHVEEDFKKPKVTAKDYLFLVIGAISLAGGAKYMVDAVIQLSTIWQIATGVVTLVAVAFGTSFPELVVSIKATRSNKSEVALGNVFGSNVFNILLVVGIPALFTPLVLDEQTFALGLPIMLMSTFLFIISGISRRIHIYEGAMYLVIYTFFIGKLFGLL